MKNYFSKWIKKPEPAAHGEINEVMVDRFTLVHFFIGFLYGYVKLGFWLTLGLAIVWEILENPLKFYLPLLFPRGTSDSTKNLISDIVAVIVGWSLAILIFY